MKQQQKLDQTDAERSATRTDNPLDTTFFTHGERELIQPHAPPRGDYDRWLSTNQIRRMQRMRRTAVLNAMLSGELPFEQRGRIRYARLSDVLLWEERRLSGVVASTTRTIDPSLADLAG